jgi:hypothetical protein
LPVVVEARAVSAAPRGFVWDVLVDGRAWGSWGPWSSTVYDAIGSPSEDGVGAVRRFRRWPVTSVERVELFEPRARFGYELVSGLPIGEYHSVVTLTDAVGGRTEIYWRSEFELRRPRSGWFWRAFLGKVLRDVSRGIAREAERRAG